MPDRPGRIGFIGIGLLGKGLALALAATGRPVTGAHSRSAASAQWLADRLPQCRAYATPQELTDNSDLVFITTPDSVIAEVAGQIRWRHGQGVAHCSGASGAGILREAAIQGAATGCFHPLQTFAGMSNAEDARSRLRDIAFAVSGDGWLGPFLEDLAHGLGGRPVNIPDADRPLYHASAILGCGYLAALLQVAVDCWRAIGFSEEEALAALAPLAATTLENIRQRGIAASVTGPAVRGDVGTMALHLEALTGQVPGGTDVYGALTGASLDVAAQRGVPPEVTAEMRELAQQYLRRCSPCPE